MFLDEQPMITLIGKFSPFAYFVQQRNYFALILYVINYSTKRLIAASQPVVKYASPGYVAHKAQVIKENKGKSGVYR